MRIQVLGNTNESIALRRRFILQEDEMTSDTPELVVELDSKTRIVPDVFVKELWGEVSTGKAEYFFTRFWHQDQFHPQHILGIPLIGLMNDNLGMETPTGCSLRFVKEVAPELFGNDAFCHFLKCSRDTSNKSYSGFVSFVMNHGKIVRVEKGIPFYGLFAAFEALVDCRISTFLKSPLSYRFREHWYSSLLLSRAPFPYVLTATKTLVTELSPIVERHFWPFAAGLVQKYSFYTDKTEIGIATGYADSARLASDRARTTCHNLKVEHKQFRTDMGEQVRKTFENLHQFLP